MPNMDLAGFIRHMAAVPMAIEAEKHHALERAAKLVENRAKRDIGTYQENIAPFANWAELAQSTQDDRTNKGYPPDEPLLRDGALRDSIGHAVDARAGEAVVGSNEDVAVFQELGTSRIPPRSFLGGAAVQEAERVALLLGHAAVKALIGRDVYQGRLPIE